MQAVEKRQLEVDKMISDQKAQLERISGFSKEEAKEQLIAIMEDEAKAEAVTLIKDLVEEA